MLSRTASSLYWLGRYIERAEFTGRLVEATVRLDAMSARPAGEGAWAGALAVVGAESRFAATGHAISQKHVSQFLTLDPLNSGSVRCCIDAARDNARAVRTALSRDAWESINRAWLGLHRRSKAGDTQATISLVEGVVTEARAFEGAMHRMLRNEAHWLMRLGMAMERGDNSARLIDVKYHLLLPQGESVGGPIDRDQWTTILHTVSAVTAYRWLYRDGLRPSSVAEMLILRTEMPRSLAASAEEVVLMLNAIGKLTGMQGEADRLARTRQLSLGRRHINSIIIGGLHEFLGEYIVGNAALDQAIAKQFRFP
ncbi:MAG: alpha-E domain-containing protein [Chakrabartia sp.]